MTYYEPGEIASFALVAAGDAGFAHELVDEWVDDCGGDRFGELEI